MHWYLLALRKYAVFGGRSSRREYWYFVLFFFLTATVLVIVDIMTGYFDVEVGIGLLSGFYVLATFIPSVAVSVRRLHDTGRSGWAYLLVLIPLIGGIVLIVFFVFDSESGENRYGSNPKDATV